MHMSMLLNRNMGGRPLIIILEISILLRKLLTSSYFIRLDYRKQEPGMIGLIPRKPDCYYQVVNWWQVLYNWSWTTCRSATYTIASYAAMIVMVQTYMYPPGFSYQPWSTNSETEFMIRYANRKASVMSAKLHMFIFLNDKKKYGPRKRRKGVGH